MQSLPHAVALAHLRARADLSSGCKKVSQLRSASRLHCFKPDAHNPFDFRSWNRGNRLPGVVEAILLEELLNAAPEALADEGDAAAAMPQESPDLQYILSMSMYGVCGVLIVVLVVGLGTMFIQDFLENRKMEEDKKKREQAKKEEMKTKAALPIAKRTGPKKTAPRPAGFGQVSR